LNYEDNLKLVAFSQQAIHGQLDVVKEPPLGMFDVIGRDRRLAWQQLGNLSKAQSMEGFIDLLDRLCPSFKPYIEAIKKDNEEKCRLAVEKEQHELEQVQVEKIRLEEQKKIEDEKNREEMQRRQLQDALNQQTYHQFKLYAEKQFPGNPEQQALLIRQLQNEHYHQYMQQLQAQVSVIDSERRNGEGGEDNSSTGAQFVCNDEDCSKENTQHSDDKETCESDSELDGKKNTVLFKPS
jgi:golgi resident protein GCP60